MENGNDNRKRYKILNLHNLSTDNLLSQITPKQNTKPHKHDCIEVFYVISGKACHILNDIPADISTGDAFFVTPDDKHCFERQSEDFLHRDILINTAYFHKICDIYSGDTYSFFMNNGTRHIFLGIDEIYSLEQSCRQVSDQPEHSDRDRSECIIVTTVLNEFLKRSKNEPTPGWLKKLALHVSTPAEFNQPISAIVAVYPFSTSYVCRTFKRYYGMTISHFFNLKKIEYAKILLLTTDYSLEQICETIGFNSVSYFCKLFKKLNGTTPSAIRQTAPVEK